jgi:hypothetical protein
MRSFLPAQELYLVSAVQAGDPALCLRHVRTISRDDKPDAGALTRHGRKSVDQRENALPLPNVRKKQD